MRRVPAGYGKVALLQELEARLHIRPDYTVYVGDGSSDMHVMQHVNSLDGHTIAVSETKSVGRIARRSVLSDNALSVLVPVLEDIVRMGTPRKSANCSPPTVCRSRRGTRSALTG